MCFLAKQFFKFFLKQRQLQPNPRIPILNILLILLKLVYPPIQLLDLLNLMLLTISNHDIRPLQQLKITLQLLMPPLRRLLLRMQTSYLGNQCRIPLIHLFPLRPLLFQTIPAPRNLLNSFVIVVDSFA